MKLFGLIGYPLTHSFSKDYFNNKFKNENISDCSYKLFDIKSINQFTSVLENNPNLEGLNVTIPYKESIIDYLTEIDETAKQIGAVNTIKISDNQKSIKGFNTDYFGFKKSLKPFLDVNHDRALILGTGGASKTVKFVLNELNIDCLLVSRTPSNDEISYEDINEYVLKYHQLIINTTPVGMFPNVEQIPQINYEYISKNHLLYDLIYNPEETKFLIKGKKRNCTTINGLEMLKLQAEKSWEIWNS